MDKYVVSLMDIQMGDTHLVGVKAAVLGELKRVGFPVPDGVSITTHAFKLALRPYLDQIDSILETHGLEDLSGSRAASKSIHAILTDLVIPAPVLMSLQQKLLEMSDPGTPLAVRSSGTAEDTPDSSFAGLYESKIGVSDNDAIHRAILDVWRSYFNPMALNYRSTTSDKGHGSSMGVLILPVMEAETSGVAFSMDPVGLQNNRVVVTASWGLGMGVVDGSVGTDTAWVTREGAAECFEIEDYQVSEKTNQYTLNTQGALVKNAVPATRQRMACLPDPWLLRVAQFCVAAEVYFGCPQDMEWAIAGGQVWVLQSRPITALPPDLRRPPYFNVDWKILGEPKLAWTQYPYWRHVLKPLEIDYAYDRRDASRESCYFTGSETFWNAKIINGYAYTTWAPSDLPAGHRRIRREMVADLGDRLHRQGLTTWDFWGPEIERATERLDRFDFENATDSQIADHLENARGVCHRHWTIHGSRLWITNRPHQSALMALLDPQNLDIKEIPDELFEGEPTPSTRLIQGLYGLAQSALESPAIASLIIDPPEDVLQVMGDHPEAAGFLNLYREFIREFGAYSGVGYGADGTITTPTWSEQPELVLGFVSRYLNPGVPDPATVRLAAQQKRDLQLKQLLERCGDSISVADLEREVDFGRRQAAIMEIHNHYIDQMMNGQLRHAILGAAGRLVKRSILSKNEDIFWLHFDEITLALRSEEEFSFEEEISSRKEQHLEWERLDPPPLLGIPQAYLPKKSPFRRMFEGGKGKPDSLLKGIGASPGRYHGRARIVSTSEFLPDIQPGEILVAKTAGPRWTPILPTLGGLVLDGGSVGQHHSIIAREFRIPAVVGTGNGTSRISDGAWVTIDGDTGAVEMEV
jgi:phosphohistidine swiveling domain-containing protein